VEVTRNAVKPRRRKVVQVTLSYFGKRPATYRSLVRRGKTVELVDRWGEVVAILTAPDRGPA
jgi:hypothetical protein